MSDSPRKIAVNILINIEKKSSFVNVELNKMRKLPSLSNLDKRFISEIVSGVIKHKITIDYIIDKYSKIKSKKMSPFVLSVLQTGVYQIVYMDKVPKSAAVNESVKLVKKSPAHGLSGITNAVLRSVNEDEIDHITGNDAEYLSIKYSYPLWLSKRWVNEFGYEFAEKIMISLDEKSDLFIRRSLGCSEKELISELKKDSVECSPFIPEGFSDYRFSYVITNVSDLTSLSAYKKNMFYIQDPSASLAAYALNPTEGECIIDLCAAPGGKSIFAAELMNNIGKVISCDIYDQKIKMIRENADKYGLKIIKPTLNDALVYNEKFENTADKIICDVPCSGFGIIKKKPDIKYSRSESDIYSLSEMGLKILLSADKYLKPGGIIVFSTCTIEKEENENVVNEFLKIHSNYSLIPFGDAQKAMYTFYPCNTGTDGFFICKLKKDEIYR